jgi:hypothetical protein
VVPDPDVVARKPANKAERSAAEPVERREGPRGMRVADDALRVMLPFDRGGHDLVEGGLHSLELELAHEVEELGSFHQLLLLRFS